MKIINWEKDFFTPGILSTVKRVEFVGDTVSYIVLRGRWCDIIVLNSHAPTDDKCGNSKDSFREELVNFNAQMERYYIF
jgi:hypothetical protein